MAEPRYQTPQRSQAAPPHWPTEGELPYEDGEPLAESDYQLEPLSYTYDALATHNAHRDDVAVQADMLVYYKALDDDGNEVLRSVAPDVFVIFGVPNRRRLSYVVYDEGKSPDFVLEVLSASTWRRDAGEKAGEKKDIYAFLGVREYWIFDPYDRYLDAPLIGYRLRDGRYERISPIDGAPSSTTSGRPSRITYLSDVLGLELRVEDGALRLRDPQTGEDLQSHRELDHAVRNAKSRAAQAESRAAQAEARLAELEAGAHGPDADGPSAHRDSGESVAPS